MNDMCIDAATFREVLGNYPTGVCVITAMSTEGKPLGMVVGSFSSVSIDPPLVGFFPAVNSSAWAQIETAGHFCVNVLASDQTTLCRQIAGPGDKFIGIEYGISQHGLPLLSGVIAHIECRLEAVTAAGDHFLVLGRVLRLAAHRQVDPMLFFRGRYGGFVDLT